jgi:hypothetical protein
MISRFLGDGEVLESLSKHASTPLYFVSRLRADSIGVFAAIPISVSCLIVPWEHTVADAEPFPWEWRNLGVLKITDQSSRLQGHGAATF